LSKPYVYFYTSIENLYSHYFSPSSGFKKNSNHVISKVTKSKLKIIFFLQDFASSTKFAKHSTLSLLFPAVLYFHPEILSLYSHNFKKYRTFNEYSDNNSGDKKICVLTLQYRYKSNSLQLKHSLFFRQIFI